MGPKSSPRKQKSETMAIDRDQLAKTLLDVGCAFAGASGDMEPHSHKLLVDLREEPSADKTSGESLSNEVQERNSKLMNALFKEFPVRDPGKRLVVDSLRVCHSKAQTEGITFSGLESADEEASEKWIDEEAAKLTILWDAAWKSWERYPAGSKNLACLRTKLVISDGQDSLRAARLSQEHHGEETEKWIDEDDVEMVDSDSGEQSPKERVPEGSASGKLASVKTAGKPARSLQREASICSISSTENPAETKEGTEPTAKQSAAPSKPKAPGAKRRKVLPDAASEPKGQGQQVSVSSDIYAARNHRSAMKKPAAATPKPQTVLQSPQSDAEAKQELTKAFDKFEIDSAIIEQIMKTSGVTIETAKPDSRINISKDNKKQIVFGIKDGPAEVIIRIQMGGTPGVEKSSSP